jgi:hypothetical protein
LRTVIFITISNPCRDNGTISDIAMRHIYPSEGQGVSKVGCFYLCDAICLKTREDYAQKRQLAG